MVSNQPRPSSARKNALHDIALADDGCSCLKPPTTGKNCSGTSRRCTAPIFMFALFPGRRGVRTLQKNRSWVLTNNQHHHHPGRSRAASLALAGCVMPQDFLGLCIIAWTGGALSNTPTQIGRVGGRSRQSDKRGQDNESPAVTRLGHKRRREQRA